MNHEMYFIPIIVQALEQQQVRHVLALAFEEIDALGQQPELAHGYTQFRRFMDLIEARCEDELCAAVRRCMLALATETLRSDAFHGQAALALVTSRPAWRSELERLSDEVRRIEQRRVWPKLVLSRDGREPHVCVLSGKASTESVSPISPGTYTLRLETGRVLWEVTLREADLVWSQSSRQRPLKLAAETPGAVAQPAREASLLGGELILRVFAGIEAGRIEVEWHGPGVQGHDQ